MQVPMTHFVRTTAVIARLTCSAGVCQINQAQSVVGINSVTHRSLDIRCFKTKFMPRQKTVRSGRIIGRFDRLFVVHLFPSYPRNLRKH